MNLNTHIQTVFFIGIGGIGMSALARYCAALGKTVYGYDKTATKLTASLFSEEILVNYEDRVTSVEENFDVETTLVVYTPAIPSDSELLNYFKNNG
ncbi:Mur ligase domain-containing protein, partial [uncultured Planktosalinus sp.]|uniref:Mur ligase domain-containing protein n=1 Tax=uncultured Planktosalinus sp. TaxID=1810935 RepID=UPI0030DDABB4